MERGGQVLADSGPPARHSSLATVPCHLLFSPILFACRNSQGPKTRATGVVPRALVV